MTSAYRLHRSLLARVLGTNEGAVLGPFGPVAVVVALNTASEGAAWEALVWLAAALPLTWLLVRNWMAGVYIDEHELVVRGSFRTKRASWTSVKRIELGRVWTGRGSWPGPILHLERGKRIDCVPFLWMGRRSATRSVRDLITAADEHDIPVDVSGGKWFWKQFRPVQ